MSKLSGSVKQLQSTLVANNARSEKWEGIKTLILNIFDKIKHEYPDLHLEISAGNVMRSVMISLPESPSTLGNRENSKMIMKKGAWMSFVQTHNGNICVLQHESIFVEDGMNHMHSEPSAEVLDISRFENHDEARELIYEHFASFLDQVNQWERRNHTTTLLEVYGHSHEEEEDNEEENTGGTEFERRKTNRTGMNSNTAQTQVTSRL